MLAVVGKAAKDDEWRDRRLEDGEEAKIRAIMAGVKPEGRERPLRVSYQAAIECLFDVAIETAMRMREIYTLDVCQVDFDRRTIFLERTKNGNKRQVPMSSVAISTLQAYMQHVESGTRGMDEFKFKDGHLFPWWDGSLDQKRLRRIGNMLSQQWQRIFSAAGLNDFRFHDLRHEATSRLFERTRLSEGEIMKITGHSSAEMLLRYANLRGSNLADKMW